jgi:hypothetical protein
MYLRSVKVDHVWDYANIDWKLALPSAAASLKAAAAWKLATVVRDAGMPIEDSKFYKSIHDECNDDGKKGSLLTMFNDLHRAIRHEDYQDVLQGGRVQVKDAGKFTYRGQNHKIWELKYQKKDRIYFFTHRLSGRCDEKLLIPMLFHHKKDQTTPKHILDYCEKTMKPFLDPNPEVKILKEAP